MSLSSIVQAAGTLLQVALAVFAALGELTLNNQRQFVVAQVKA